MYHHSEGYPNAPQHSSTEGSPAPPPHPALASVLPKESLNKLLENASPLSKTGKQSFPSHFQQIRLVRLFCLKASMGLPENVIGSSGWRSDVDRYEVVETLTRSSLSRLSL